MGNRQKRKKKRKDLLDKPIAESIPDSELEPEQRARDTEPIKQQEAQAQTEPEPQAVEETPVQETYTKPKGPEEVLVIDRNHLFGGKQKNRFQGFASAEDAGDRFLNVIYDPKFTYFAMRDMVETDSNKKQIIPYCVVYHTEFGIPSIYLMRRTKKAGEKRLHDLFSIGVGGHINPVDEEEKQRISDRWRIRSADQQYLDTPLWTGMRREFEEEIDCPSERLPKIIGYINDDSNDVGKVHFGVVFLVRSGRRDIYVNEPDQLEGRLVTLENFNPEGELENWSKILYPHIEKILNPKKNY